LRAAAPVDVTGTAIAWSAVLLAAATGLRGIDGLFPDGHFSSVAAIGVFADNMLRWKTLLPVMGYLDHAPASGNYYMHHPLGMFWITALLERIFGFHNWVLRLPAVVYVTATPYFIWRIGRDLWGPIEGGLSALAFVALPITLGYANYNDLEQPMMLGCIVGSWGYLRFATTWKDRYALCSVFGFLFAINHDWEGYIWGAFLLTGLFIRGYLIPERLLGPVSARPFGRYWALMCSAAAVSLGAMLMLLDESGRLGDLVSSYALRSGGSSIPLEVVLAARSYRIELMFSGLAIFLGKLAVPVILGRAVVKRSDLELLPLPLLLTALVQYLVFKQGADVHIFWPHPFATYFGLAAGALAASVKETVAWAARRSRAPVTARLGGLAPWLPLLLVGLPLLVVLRDGLSLVRLSRETGGRFAEANDESYIDQAVALRWFVETHRLPETAGVEFHGSVLGTWALKWLVRPRSTWAGQPVAAPVPAAARAFILDSRTTSLGELRTAASRFHVEVVGPYWLFDRQAPPAPLDGYDFDAREPSFFDRWSQGATEPIRTVRADPWTTWEWRTLLGQPASQPGLPAATPEQVRIAHNAALARGDVAAAVRLRAALVAQFNLTLHARYDNQTELIGGIQSRGAQRSITLYFVSGTFRSDTKFAVQAKVVAPPTLSTLPMDPGELDLALPPRWPTTLWRPGQIYSIKLVYRRRPGHERLRGGWADGVRRTDAAGPDEIAYL
jgi:dolichyl-phosphate-mannose-protein mannosyltransferase